MKRRYLRPAPDIPKFISTGRRLISSNRPMVWRYWSGRSWGSVPLPVCSMPSPIVSETRSRVGQSSVFIIVTLWNQLRPHLLTPLSDLRGLSASELLSVVADFQQQLAAKDFELQQRDKALEQRDRSIFQRQTRIQLLEEFLRLKQIQKFAASSEKLAHQHHLFDEAKLEAEIDVLRDQLPEDVEEEGAPKAADPAVTCHACLGRERGVEQSVPSGITLQNRNPCDFQVTLPK